jgi:hypothetical protein
MRDVIITGNPCNFIQIGPNMWEIQENVQYTIVYQNGDCKNILVQRGFKYDLASVPKVFQWMLGKKEELAIEACLLHDYVYRTHVISRKDADDSFLLIMNKYKNPKWPWQRWAMYQAVRMFGGKPYEKKS